jgi:hypothetical protein
MHSSVRLTTTTRKLNGGQLVRLVRSPVFDPINDDLVHLRLLQAASISKLSEAFLRIAAMNGAHWKPATGRTNSAECLSAQGPAAGERRAARGKTRLAVGDRF